MRTKLKGHDITLRAPVRYAHLARQWPWEVCTEVGSWESCLGFKIQGLAHGRRVEIEGKGLADESW